MENLEDNEPFVAVHYERSIFRGGITPAHLATLGILAWFFAGKLGIMRVWILQIFRAFGRRLLFFSIFRSGTLMKIIKNNFQLGISFRRSRLVLKIIY